MTTLFLAFSLDSSAARRAQHSFPTRRSSDLHQGRRARTSGGRGRRWLRHRPHALHGGPLGRGSRPQLDRKSTRLNSSHVSISYAVFCLKKKKRTHVCTQFMFLSLMSFSV